MKDRTPSAESKYGESQRIKEYGRNSSGYKPKNKCDANRAFVKEPSHEHGDHQCNPPGKSNYTPVIETHSNFFWQKIDISGTSTRRIFLRRLTFSHEMSWRNTGSRAPMNALLPAHALLGKSWAVNNGTLSALSTGDSL